MEGKRSLKGRLKRHHRVLSPKQAEAFEEQKRQERRVARQAEVERTIKVLEDLERRRQEAERLGLEPEPEPQPEVEREPQPEHEPEPQPTGPRKNWSKMRQGANRLRVDRFKDKVNTAYSRMKQGDVGDSTWSEKLNELRYDKEFQEFQDIMEKKAHKMKIPRKNRDENRQVITGSFPRKYLYGNIPDETQMGRKAYNHLLASLDEYNKS